MEDGTFGAARDEDRVYGVPCQRCFGGKDEVCLEGLEVRRRDVQQTSFLCPRRTTHSFIERMSNTRTVWSREALASRFPWGAQASACMVFLCWWSVVSPVPVRGSQNLMRLSLLPDTSRPMVGCHSTHLTSHPCPVRMRSSRLSAKDQTRTVESSLAVAKRASSGEKLSPRTASRCAGHAVRLFMLGWKYLTMPDWSADAMYVPA